MEFNIYGRGTHSLLKAENKYSEKNCSKHLQIETSPSPEHNWSIESDPDFDIIFDYNSIESICMLPRLLFPSIFLKSKEKCCQMVF